MALPECSRFGRGETGWGCCQLCEPDCTGHGAATHLGFGPTSERGSTHGPYFFPYSAPSHLTAAIICASLSPTLGGRGVRHHVRTGDHWTHWGLLLRPQCQKSSVMLWLNSKGQTMKAAEFIERYVIYALMTMLALGIVLGAIALGIELVETIISPPFLLIEPQALFSSFGRFLIILIGLELLKLLRLHLLHHQLRPEVVIAVAMIAVCNKVVTLDIKHLEGSILIGLAALLLALSMGYYIFLQAPREKE